MAATHWVSADKPSMCDERASSRGAQVTCTMHCETHSIALDCAVSTKSRRSEFARRTGSRVQPATTLRSQELTANAPSSFSLATRSAAAQGDDFSRSGSHDVRLQEGFQCAATITQRTANVVELGGF